MELYRRARGVVSFVFTFIRTILKKLEKKQLYVTTQNSTDEMDDPGGGADDNVPGGGSPSILLSMNWTTPAVGLMMTTPVVGP